jgi:hypothetical protein
MQEEIRQELGKPHRLLPEGNVAARYTDIEARTGETQKHARPEPEERHGSPEQEGEVSP